MNSEQLKQFKTIVDCGNLTRAAAELYISQPALSISISKLEDEIGRPLFIRNGKKLELTAAGSVLLDYAERVTSLINEAEREMNRIDSLSYVPAGYIGGIWMSPLLEGCFELEKNRFSLACIHNYDVPTAIAESRFGLLVADKLYTEAAAYKSVEKLFLFTQSLLLSVDRNDPLSERDEIPVQELENLMLIGSDNPLGLKDWLMDIDRQNHCIIPIRMNCGISLFESDWKSIHWPFLVSSFGLSRSVDKPWWKSRKLLKVTGKYTSRDIYLWYDGRVKKERAAEINLICSNAHKINDADRKIF